MVLTDSIGLQEETTVFGVPCVTIRHNTEWTISCDVGINTIVCSDPEEIGSASHMVLNRQSLEGQIPTKRPGHATGLVSSQLIVSCVRKIDEFVLFCNLSMNSVWKKTIDEANVVIGKESECHFASECIRLEAWW